MSRTRIVGGVYTKITGGDYKMYTEGDTIISAAGKNDFANAEEVIIGTNPERCEPISMDKFLQKRNEGEVPNFLVYFERPRNYDGSFGFDWMRNNYKKSKVCESTEYIKLKDEYKPFGSNTFWVPNNKEYFVPWLSMRKGQLGVKLIVKVKKIDKKSIKKDDFITFEGNSVSFISEKIYLKDIPKRGLEVTILCNSVSETDRLCNVLDSSGKIVGKLNLFRNKTTYELDVRFVEVKFKGVITQAKEMGQPNNFLRHYEREYNLENNHIKTSINIQNNSLSQAHTILKWKKYISDTINISTNLLNQALIEYKPNMLPNGDINYEILTVDLGIFGINQEIRDDIVKDKIRMSFNDIYFDHIDCILEQLVKGLGEFYLRTNSNCKGVVVFLIPLVLKQDIYNFEAYSDEPLKEGRFIILLDNDKIKDTTIVHEIGHTLGLVHSFQELLIDQENRTFVSKYIFKEGKTENIMDYSQNTISFWKWQWEEMQKDDIDLVSIIND